MSLAREPTSSGGREVSLQLRLYVAGAAPNSLAALDNLRALCRDEADGGCDLEVVDVLEAPERALDDGIIVTPTLVRLDARPPAYIVGDLSDRESLLVVLGIRGGARR